MLGLRSALTRAPAGLRLLQAGLDAGNPRILNVKVEAAASEMSFRFPLSMLRDNCPSNFHPSTLQRLTPMCREVLNSSAENVEIRGSGSSLQVHWAGEPIRTAAFAGKELAQVSDYSVEWLYQHAIEKKEERSMNVHWWKEVQPLLPDDFMPQWQAAVGSTNQGADSGPLTFEYCQLVSDEATLLRFLKGLWSHGLVFVTGIDPVDRDLCKLAEEAPEQGVTEAADKMSARLQVENALATLQEKISFARQTHYGTRFHVKSKENANNQAYTTQELALHTDLPFINHAPDIQILHCVQNDNAGPESGGESTFADGVATALGLWKRHPEAYKLLKEKKVMYSDWHNEGLFEFHSEKAIITEAPVRPLPGSPPVISHVHFNEGVRCHFLNSCSSPEEVDELYAAFVLLQEEIQRLKISFKLRPGEMVAFNNNRVLHGRRAFKPSGYRHLVGGYVDWDDVWSCRRRLERSVSEE